MGVAQPPPSKSYRNAATRRMEAELIDLCHRCQTDKALFARAFFGIELTPFQREVVSPSGRVDATVAGRRTGKTTAKVVDRIHDLATQGYNRVGYVGAPSLDQAEQYVREIEAAAERSVHMQALLEGGPARAIRRQGGFPTVTLVTGGRLECRSTVQDGRYLRGKGADWVVLNEAGFINDAVYDRVVRAMVLDRRGSVHLDSSPNGDNFLKRLFDRANVQQGKYRRASDNGYYTASHGTVYDNPLLSVDDLEAIRTEVPEWVWRVEYMAEFVDADDAVFPWSLLLQLFDYDYGQIHEAYDATKRYAIGVDLAQVHDYTAICVLDITGEPPYRLAHWRRFRGVAYMGVGGVVDQVNTLREAFNGARVYVDATSERAVAESIPGADAVIFTGDERTKMLSNLIVRCEQRHLQLPASYMALRDEMRAFKRTKTPTGHVRMDHPREGFDDTIWSLALAVRGLARAGTSRTREAVSIFRGGSFWGN